MNGFACLALMLVMAGAGFLMAPYSSWDNFQSFSIGFAAPWFVWAVAICEVDVCVLVVVAAHDDCSCECGTEEISLSSSDGQSGCEGRHHRSCCSSCRSGGAAIVAATPERPMGITLEFLLLFS